MPTSWNYSVDPILGSQLAYRVGGLGKSVVLLHGFGTTSATWMPCVAALPAKYRYFMPDLPGHGRSTRDRSATDPVQHSLDIFTAFLNSLAADQYILVGHSLGGLLVLLALLNDSIAARTSALVLVDVPAFPQALPKVIRFFRARVWSSVLSSLLPSRTLVYLAQREVFAQPSRIPTFLIDEYTASLRAHGTIRSLQRLAAALSDWAASPPPLHLDRIRVPTLIVWGSHDELVPPESGQALHAAIPGSTLSVFPRTGHAPQEECPEDFAAVFSRFLSEVA